MYDGNYVVASNHKTPWLKQLNMLIGYASFYNPVRLAAMLLGTKTKVSHKAGRCRSWGCWACSKPSAARRDGPCG